MDRPIGVIDSGVGGLTVAKEIMRQLPNEKIIYLGDTARCPYGPRSGEEVKAFTWELTRFLLQKNIKMLVIACNTATAVALDEIKEQLSIPVIGVIVPGARTAIKVTRNNYIGMIGTIGTVKSKAYEKALKQINKKVRTESLACPKFVPLVESGEYDGPVAKRIVRQTLAPFKGSDIDTLILGCTHYPLLEKVIREEMGDKVKVISSGAETAREVSTILAHSEQLASPQEKNEHEFYTTGSSDIFARIASDWLDQKIEAVETIKLS
ncbi:MULTISPECIES: glutamate racemase [Bacillaceae]|uniref:glutamate racemase n=1 Tax=Bacillaceae TaxID=186817 RepID=UPI001E45280F|nr:MULTISPECIES: glutamate racemase [Bacillaceae]MCE4051549.1 glutamate racemase [Bacillus sp. Au-Bac7]MDL0436219.1 glutamate racemase [Niallia sp. SS-2023]UPO86784.1 glutamate racemase [Niallia sp. Man26]